MRCLLALSLSFSLTVFLFCNTYSCLISMRSYCKFWNVLFLFLCSIWFHFFHLFHNLGWITKGHAFLKAHMPHPCVLLRIQGETKGPIPFFFFFLSFFNSESYFAHSIYSSNSYSTSNKWPLKIRKCFTFEWNLHNCLVRYDIPPIS